jgi:hypothetical protein
MAFHAFHIVVAGSVFASGSAATPIIRNDDGSCSKMGHDSSSLLQSKASFQLSAADRSTLKQDLDVSVEAKAKMQVNGTYGFDIDFPLNYTTASILAYQKPSHESAAAALKEQHAIELAACARQETGILETGGWCYSQVGARHASSGTLPDGNHDMDASTEYDEDFFIPEHHVGADSVIVQTLAKEFLKKQDGSCCWSLSDFGAGVGQVGHALRAVLPSLEYHGYDGAGNIEEFTKGYVKFADLTKPLNLKQTDYVLSAEVGEHIPNQFEQQVIQNLHAHNCKGIVLTWAVLGQGGNGHVNCHSNEYLINIFENLGYRYNHRTSQLLRNNHSSHYWFTGSAMAFDRIHPQC